MSARRVVLVVLCMLAWQPMSSMAAKPATVEVPGKPSKRKVTGTTAGKVVLYGPVSVPKQLKGTSGIVTLVLEDVRFAPDTGNESMLYLVDAGKGDKPLNLDPTNYVGSAGNVAGMKSEHVRIQTEVNDFSSDDKKYLPRTHLRAMDRVYLALVIVRGDVSFGKATLALETPPADPGAKPAK